nr:MAG TPA: hypothetical protein [Caudoviricetes sp.]
MTRSHLSPYPSCANAVIDTISLNVKPAGGDDIA